MAQIFRPPKKRGKAKQQPAHFAIEADITDLDHHGVGVCRHDEKVVFVEGALPGDRCQVLITEQKPRFMNGRVKQLIEQSPIRTEPFCEYYQHCGGCQTQHGQPDAVFEAKQNAIDGLLQRIGGMSSLPWQAPVTSQSQGYRRKTRLAVDARREGDIRLGYRAKASKDIVSVAHCGILVPELSELLKPLHLMLNAMDVPRSVGHIGLCRGQSVTQVCVRVTKPLSTSDTALLVTFAQENSCEMVLETAPDKFTVLVGDSPRIDISTAEGFTLSASPNDFIQVNAAVNLAMVEQAISWLAPDPNDHIIDLFCGLGNFTLPLAKYAAQVTGVEGVAEMVQGAEANAQKNGITNAAFVTADLNQSAWLRQASFSKAKKVLLDPARDGALSAVEHIADSHVEKVVYVSCNPATFARDARKLIESEFSLHKIALMDMFPHTSHTELMALFVRNP